jgi:hypothetical protein
MKKLAINSVFALVVGLGGVHLANASPPPDATAQGICGACQTTTADECCKTVGASCEVYKCPVSPIKSGFTDGEEGQG